MSKIHVLPDENLGGVLREYVEVDRTANVGDKIVITDPSDFQFGDNYTKGTVMTVTKADEDGSVYCGKFDLIDIDEYQTLEPTYIVHIDGVRYRMVGRNAKVGEKVIVFGHSNENGNGVFKVEDVYKVNDAVSYVGKDMRGYAVSSENYRVLEPVEPNEIVNSEEGDDKSVLDLLANLARRVTKLERENKELRHQSHNHRLDIEQIYIDVKSLRENVDVLDERTQPLLALIKAVEGKK